MSKKATSLIIFLIAFGMLAVSWGSRRREIHNSEPVHLPVPGAGLQVMESFQLETGGRFALQVGTPATPAEVKLRRPQPNLACDLAVVLTGPHGFNIRRRITTLHNGGWSDQNLFYPDELFVVPGGGKYTVTISSRTIPPLFNARGAMITLERWEDVGSALGWAFAVWLGYGSLGCALIAAVLLRWTNRTRVG